MAQPPDPKSVPQHLAKTIPDAPASVAKPGLVIGERYRLVSMLGNGATSSVWVARDEKLSSNVALKLMDPEIVSDKRALSRFMREAKSAATLRSPHVVQTFDHGIDDKRPYIAMELLEGESLKARLQRKGCLPHSEVALIVTHIARALSRAHEEGIVHRDVKPDNVFLVRNDDEVIAKVLDFGAAKLTNAKLMLTMQTETGVLVGTPYYMSPEQAHGKGEVDFRADLWSLGVLTFEMLLGVRPFQTGALGDLIMKICMDPIPVPSQIGEVPAGFDEWFARATERDPKLRAESVKIMAEQLRLLLDPESDRNTPLSARKPIRQTIPVAAQTNNFAQTQLSAVGHTPSEKEPNVVVVERGGPRTLISGERPTAASEWKWVVFAIVVVLGLLAGLWRVLL